MQSHLILVGGGTGFVGRHLVRCLRDSGAKVCVITRKPNSDSSHISWDAIIRKGLPEGTTAVVNVAGRNILDPLPWTESYKTDVYRSRVDSNRILATAIKNASTKPKSFVTISGVGYYEPTDSLEYDESWMQPKDLSRCAGRYLMTLARDWEDASKPSTNDERSNETRRAIIRSGVVLGGSGGIIANLSLPFKLGLGGRLGSGTQWFPWIHVEDLAELFKFVINNDSANNIINGVAPSQVTNNDFANSFAKVLNRQARLPTPEFAIKIMFGNDRADILLKGQRVKSRAEILGFKFKYTNLEDACKASV